MPNIALVPTTHGLEAPSKFTPINALQGCPEEWRPTEHRINPVSFPSPFGRSWATRLLLGRGDFGHALARASVALLKGLVGGALRFRWIGHTDVQSPQLQGLLQRSLDAGWPYLGLIEDSEDQTWGYMVDPLMPVLAGAREGEIRTLEERVRAKTNDREVFELLSPLKTWFKDRNGWDPTESSPWMMLVDRVLRDTQGHGEPGPLTVNLRLDVRSYGPFLLRGLAGSPTTHFYLPSLSRGFVDHLAQAVMRADVHQPEGSPYLLLRPAEVRGEVKLVHRPGPASVLDGVVVGSPPAPPARPSELALADRELTQRFDTHLSAARGRTDDQILTTLFFFSDIQRLIAVHAPERLGGQRAPISSETLKLSRRTRSVAQVLDHVQATALEEKGYSVLVTVPDDSTAAFVEWDTDGKTRIGDLSTLGLGLWQRFTGKHYAADGKPHLSEQRPFPIGLHEALRSWWNMPAEYDATRKQLASLQRFVASYPGADEGLAKLKAFAVRHFVERLFEHDKGTGKQLLETSRQEAGWPVAEPLLSGTAGLMQHARDPLRDAGN